MTVYQKTDFLLGREWKKQILSRLICHDKAARRGLVMRDSQKKKERKVTIQEEKTRINRKRKKTIETERARWAASNYQIISHISTICPDVTLLSKLSLPLPLFPYNTISQHSTVTVRASVMHDIHFPRLPRWCDFMTKLHKWFLNDSKVIEDN